MPPPPKKIREIPQIPGQVKLSFAIKSSSTSGDASVDEGKWINQQNL
jgi:hypothetical protein